MTARTPIYYDSGNLVEMTGLKSTNGLHKQSFNMLVDLSVALTVSAGSGNIGTTLSDTRFRSSVATQQTTAHATAGALDTVTTNFNHIVITDASVSVTGDTNNVLFPVYYDSGSGSVQSMTEADFVDTFIKCD